MYVTLAVRLAAFCWATILNLWNLLLMEVVSRVATHTAPTWVKVVSLLPEVTREYAPSASTSASCKSISVVPGLAEATMYRLMLGGDPPPGRGPSWMEMLL